MFSPSQFDGVKSTYDMPPSERARIRGFLEEHGYLYAVLKEAKTPIASVFGDEVELHLELEQGPEDGSAGRHFRGRV